MDRWIPFYFEGNLWFGMVDNPQDWVEVVKAYSEYGDGIDVLLGAKRGYELTSRCPRFGLYGEYTGKQTLGEWAKDLGMNLT